jgi:hypothetical protein
MPHTLAHYDSGSGNLTLVSPLFATPLVVAANALPFAYRHLTSVGVSIGFNAGANVLVLVLSTGAFQVGQFVEVTEGANKDYTSVTAINPGVSITLKALVNNYSNLAKVNTLDIEYDKVQVLQPSCPEQTILSHYASVNDNQAVRAVWTALLQPEFDFMVAFLGFVLAAGPRAQQVAELSGDLFAQAGQKPAVKGQGIYDPQTPNRDRGDFVSYARASLSDEFESFVGLLNSFDQMSFEAPFDMLLEHASVFTNASTATDAYLTIIQNDVTIIVPAGPLPPNRNLPAVTGLLQGFDLANVPITKGDKITVKLNLVTAQTITRCKWTIGYKSKLVSVP